MRVGGSVGVVEVVEVKVAVGLEVKVAVGLETAGVSVGWVVSVGCNVSVGALVLEASGVVVVGTLVLVGDGSANLIPPSERARSKTPVTIAHENMAAMMPITIPIINRLFFSFLSFMCYASSTLTGVEAAVVETGSKILKVDPLPCSDTSIVCFNQCFYNR